MHDRAQATKWIAEAQSVAVFTGAGISTESGIPDFRSPGGVWEKYRTVYFDEFMASEEARQEYWRQKSEAHREFARAAPNRGHEILARWEQRGWIRGVITQNIDGLHQMSGSENVLELHGTAREAACMECGDRQPIEPLVSRFVRTDSPPRCDLCSGPMKHATISFGQSLPTEVLREAETWMREADLVLAFGSSLVVTPAATLPQLAVSHGARLLIINRDPTPLDHVANLVINDALGSTLDEIDAMLK